MYEISIPVWFDYKKLRPRRKLEFKRISIPVWFDYKNYFIIIDNFVWYISIPVWFDYKYIIETFNAVENAFQFQYGSIIRISYESEERTDKEISIPVWFDYKQVFFFLRLRSRLISIPVWFDYK